MNILWLPHAPWHVPQRARFFTEAMANRHDMWVTDWDGDFRRMRDLVSRRYLLNLVPRRWHDRNVTVQHVPRVSPALFSRRLQRLNDALYRRTLKRVISEAAIDVVVGCFVAPVPEGIPTVTDIFDDNAGLWLEQGTFAEYATEIRAREQRWIERSRATTVVSSVLGDRLRDAHPDASVFHIPNGVDTRSYVPDRRAARRALGLEADRIYVGNIGALSNQREADRLIAVARALEPHSGVEMVVVGGGAAAEYFERTVAAKRLANVRIVGFTRGDTLRRYFQALDIGLCPYDETPANDARVPMRLLHYSAVGATVVSSRLAEVERLAFANVVFGEAEPDGFARAVVSALDLSSFVPDEIGDYDIDHLAKRYESVLESVHGA